MVVQMSLSINPFSHNEVPLTSFPGYAPQKAGAAGPTARPQDHHGDALHNLRLEGHLENFSQTGNAPSLQSFASAWGNHDEAPAPAVANHLEERETNVQNRYEHQQNVYQGSLKSKRKLGMNIRLGIHIFTGSARKYRMSLKELYKADAGSDSAAKTSGLRDMIDMTSTVTGNIKPMLDMSQQVREQDQKIREAHEWVGKDELEPEDLAVDSGNRAALSSPLQNEIGRRSVRSLDPSEALQQAHWEKDWAADTTDDMLGLMDEADGLMVSMVKKQQEDEKAQRAGKGQEDPLKDKSFATAHQHDQSVQRIVVEQASMKNTLKAVRQD